MWTGTNYPIVQRLLCVVINRRISCQGCSLDADIYNLRSNLSNRKYPNPNIQKANFKFPRNSIKKKPAVQQSLPDHASTFPERYAKFPMTAWTGLSDVVLISVCSVMAAEFPGHAGTKPSLCRQNYQALACLPDRAHGKLRLQVGL